MSLQECQVLNADAGSVTGIFDVKVWWSVVSVKNGNDHPKKAADFRHISPINFFSDRGKRFPTF
jgi:hypothetical protein